MGRCVTNSLPACEHTCGLFLRWRNRGLLARATGAWSAAVGTEWVCPRGAGEWEALASGSVCMALAHRSPGQGATTWLSSPVPTFTATRTASTAGLDVSGRPLTVFSLRWDARIRCAN